MNVIGRAGWILSAALFATLLSSLVHVDYVGVVPVILALLLGTLCALRPAAGLEIACALIPVSGFLARQRWSGEVPWAEVTAIAVIAGASIDAARGKSGRRVPFAVAAPALLFGVAVAGSMIASLGVLAVRLGPGFVDALRTQLTREYFVDVRGFPAVHTGLLLIEGTLLVALTARITNGRPATLRRFASTAAIGAVLAGGLNIAKLLQASARSGAFASSLVDMAANVRWNIHYGDYNAAGSYFAMAALLAIALAFTSRARALWIAAAAATIAALYLTGSRAASAAAVIALASAVLMHRLGASRRRLAALAGISLAAGAVLVGIMLLVPHRGNQQSPLMAADVRIEMAKVGGRMIARYPVFGIGLGEFYQRSGNFSPWALFEKFPVAVHENAHNNFVQVAAELGLPGAVLFVWLVFGALFVAAHGVHADTLRLFVLAALGAFVLTWMAGHPLLVHAPAYVFWILLGAAAGSASVSTPPATSSTRQESGPALHPSLSPRPSSRRAGIVAACAVLIAAMVPWHMRAMANEADLEHIGIGLSPWQVSEDGWRYREGQGHAILFVPSGGFRLDVNPRLERAVRAELRLDGRVANVVVLQPREWNALKMPARSEPSRARYSRLDLRILDDPRATMWITKVEPIDPPASAQRSR